MSSAATSLLPPAAVAQLDISGSVTLVGHSLGAMVALACLARRSSARPANPDSLVLVATPAGRLTERGLGHLLATPGIGGLCRLVEHAPAHALRALAAPAQALRALAAPACAALGRWSGCGQTQRATLVAPASAALATTPASTAVALLPALRQFDVYPMLGSIRASTVVISGGADLLTPPVHGRDIAEHIPGAAHLCVPGAAHMPQQAPTPLPAPSTKRSPRPPNTFRDQRVVAVNPQRGWHTSPTTPASGGTPQSYVLRRQPGPEIPHPATE
jgi:pimeloyl-ACP methyl ester carboxylesterase